MSHYKVKLEMKYKQYQWKIGKIGRRRKWKSGFKGEKKDGVCSDES